MQGDHRTYQNQVEPYLQDISKWYGEGMTKKSIANKLGINLHSLMKYQREHEELMEAFANADHTRDALVLDKMFQLTQGVTLEEVRERLNPATGELEITDIIKRETVPNIKALLNHQANRRLANSYDDELMRAKIRMAKAEADIKEDIANKLASGELTNELLEALVNVAKAPDKVIAPEPERIEEVFDDEPTQGEADGKDSI